MMGKLKTKSALTKRIKVTASGKVKRGQGYRSHLAQNKSTKQKRQARRQTLWVLQIWRDLKVCTRR